ncbi:MAG: F420-dependent oxidoreductase, family [Frankiales bacterium]|jgi:G6PDH family F420-dependent oxidoreductase|nr:F420-dependent oxidoreductase, family [Frankiales bacterium]
MTRFGYFLSAEELGPRELVATGQAAEAAGFDRVWVSDHYHPWLEVQGQSPFVWSVLGALAASTSLRLTTAVTCPSFRIHPAVLAQAAATTAALAPGRFTFGIGSGEALNEHVLGDAWPPVSVRHARLEEAVDVLRQLWTGRTVTHEGSYFTVHNARLFSLPAEPPPIYISGFGPEATSLAARIGDGWITTSPDRDGLELFRRTNQGGTQAGLKICWAATEEEAQQTALRYWGHQGMGGQAAQDLPMWHEFEALAAQNTPEKVAESVACGPDPKKAAAALRAYVDAGFDEVYVAQMGPDQEGGLRFLSEQVLPLL